MAVSVPPASRSATSAVSNEMSFLMTEPPDLLDGAGLALWRKLADEFEFDGHDEVLAVELCRTVSLCEQLHRRLLADGLLVEGQRGAKVNPIAAELRQQRIVLARLTASLVIPSDDDAQPKLKGAARGAYTPRAVSS